MFDNGIVSMQHGSLKDIAGLARFGFTLFDSKQASFDHWLFNLVAYADIVACRAFFSRGP